MLRSYRPVVFLVVFLLLGISFLLAGVDIVHRGSVRFHSQDGSVQLLSASQGAQTYHQIIGVFLGIGVAFLAVSIFLSLRIMRAVRAGDVLQFPPMTPSRLILLILALLLILLAIIFRHGVHI